LGCAFSQLTSHACMTVCMLSMSTGSPVQDSRTAQCAKGVSHGRSSKPPAASTASKRLSCVWRLKPFEPCINHVVPACTAAPLARTTCMRRPCMHAPPSPDVRPVAPVQPVEPAWVDVFGRCLCAFGIGPSSPPASDPSPSSLPSSSPQALLRAGSSSWLWLSSSSSRVAALRFMSRHRRGVVNAAAAAPAVAGGRGAARRVACWSCRRGPEERTLTPAGGGPSTCHSAVLARRCRRLELAVGRAENLPGLAGPRTGAGACFEDGRQAGAGLEF